MTMIQHHPGDDLLVAYAAGSLDEGLSLMVATHTALCPTCRARVTEAEEIGGALVEEMEPEPLAADSLAAVMARLDDPAPAPDAPSKSAIDDETTRSLIPEPLRSYLSDSIDALPWRSFGPTVKGLDLPVSGTTRARLFRIKPGAAHAAAQS